MSFMGPKPGKKIDHNFVISVYKKDLIGSDNS